MSVDQQQLQKQLTQLGESLNVPGVAVGVHLAGEEHYAFHGVTNIENPLAVDENTLFQFGSTGKTYTSTAIMRLVEEGKVDLHAPVRTYVPELKLRDEGVARDVTILQLLNHTAGWDGDLFADTGNGDDALEKYVVKMADIQQVTPLGSVVSYNNASLSLAGRVIEKVTGKPYETAMRELVLDPLDLSETFFFPNEIMTRRFASGHNQAPDGTITIARPWAMARSGNPAGGMSATARDQVAWALFHLGDGRARDGHRVLSEELLKQMQQPTAEMKGSALGDYVGISWLLRDVEGIRIVGHGGDTIGQHSHFLMIPERDFAFTVLTNCGPNGSQLMEELERWALEAYVGVVEKDPEPVQLDAAALQPYTGRYETIAAWADLSVDTEGRLVIDVELKPETKKQLLEAGEEEPEQPPIPIGILPGDGAQYIVSDGPAKGMKGYFVRTADGMFEAVHIGGRLAKRVKNA